MTDTPPPPNDPPAVPRGLHQISLRYAPLEDRVLLIMTTEDGDSIRLWLTRRFVRAFWGGLPKILSGSPSVGARVREEARDAVLAMRHHEALQGSDFDTPFQGKAQTPEEDRSAPLVIGVKASMKDSGHAEFSFQTTEGGGLAFTLGEKLLHAFCHLLIEVTMKAGWDLDLRVGDGNVVLPEGERGRVH